MPISKVSVEEKEQFLTAVKDYVYGYASSESAKRCSTDYDYLLRFWDEAKSEYLYKLLGQQLIISKPFVYEKNREDLIGELKEKFMSNENYIFFNEFREKVVYNSMFYGEKHPETGYALTWYIESLINLSMLADNRYKDDSFFLPSPKTGKKFEIVRGCKLSKILGKIAEEYSLEGYEEFRIAHSQALNNKKMSGTLCLSIHPNDYASMSDNTYDWDSCMSWESNGGYCQGTVEMMNSDKVLVAYVKGERDNFHFGGQKWSNKKWRELFVVCPDVIAEIAPYPYANDSITKAAIDWIKELAEKNLGWNHFEKKMRTWISGVVDSDRARIHFTTSAMYNDFRFEHACYLNKNLSSEDQHYVHYSGVSECLSCGEASYDWNDLLSDEGRLICEDCDASFVCSCCGDRRYDAPTYLNGEPVCEYCYDNYTLECVECGEVLIEDSGHYVQYYLGREDEGWLSTERNKKCICCDCHDKFFKKALVEGAEIRKVSPVAFWSDVEYIDIRDLTDYGVKCLMDGCNNVEEALEYQPSNYDRIVF